MNDTKGSIHLPVHGCQVPLEVSKGLETSAGPADIAQDRSLPEGATRGSHDAPGHLTWSVWLNLMLMDEVTSSIYKSLHLSKLLWLFLQIVKRSRCI